MSRPTKRDLIILLVLFATLITCLFLPYYERYVSVISGDESVLYKEIYSGAISSFPLANIILSLIAVPIALLDEDKGLQKIYFIPFALFFLTFLVIHHLLMYPEDSQRLNYFITYELMLTADIGLLLWAGIKVWKRS